MGQLGTNAIFAEYFLLKEKLAAGTVAEVWLAEDWRTAGRLVSLRLYAPAVRLDQYTQEALMKELEARSALQHPHLAIPSSYGIAEGIPYEVLPFSIHTSLRHRQKQEGLHQEQQVALLIRQAADALLYLHQQQPPVFHRQLTTASVYLQENGIFQLAAPALSQSLRHTLHQLTATPIISDTSYAAPELFSQHPVYSEASDMFALGVCLYEFCTGQLPWLGNGGISLNQGAEIPVVPAPYSRILSNLIRACLHPDPDKRPTAQTLVEEATYYLEHGNWKPYGAFGDVTAESIVYKERSYLWPVLLGLVLVVAALGAAYYFLVWNNPERVAKEPMDETAPVVAAGQAPVLAADTARADTRAQARTQAIEEPKPATVPARPTPAETQKTAPVAKAPATAPATQPSAPPQPAYPRPGNLEDYLNGLLNPDVPFRVREGWRTAFRKYFSPQAIIYVRMNGAPLGSFGVNEFMDILMSTDGNNGIVVDKVLREEGGTIDELNVSIIPIE